ncbi:MAG: RNA pseudouridine synthase [Candidatus Paceibacterota bacterium]|jgi:23S rRNA pseudouridine1911/1915/1917 synthase
MNKNIKIITETENYLVIDKPAGLAMHNDGFNKEETLVDWILQFYPDLENVGEPLSLPNGKSALKPGLVHRLDKDTSGVIMIAKNQKTFYFFKNEFQTHQTQKTYRAILEGELKLKKDEIGIIKLPIGRSRKDPRRRVASPKAFGRLREAFTEYKLLENFIDFSYIEAYPKTGRTHQLRAHFKAINHSIVCDKLYSQNSKCPPPLDRQALHAFSLEINLPEEGRKIFKAPLPTDMMVALENLRSSC